MMKLSDPYPYAIDECFDVYRVIVESAGTVIGMSGTKLNVVLAGDSASVYVHFVWYILYSRTLDMFQRRSCCSISHDQDSRDPNIASPSPRIGTELPST